MYSCRLKMLTTRVLVMVVLICVPEDALRLATHTPPVVDGLAVPADQKRLPSSLVALRMSPPLNALFIKVEVSIELSLMRMRAITRETVALEVPAIAAVPGAAAKPAMMRYWPSALSVTKPSEVAVPLSVNGICGPAAVAGSARVPDEAPAVVRSSKN